MYTSNATARGKTSNVKAVFDRQGCPEKRAVT
jgi:hypothetical protein